jgi:ABC-type branched-subunit amino acid transport system substrate-binding protein
MPARKRNLMALAAFAAAAAMTATAGNAQKKYDPGASDTEIKIGNIMPYSGPASSYGVIGRTEAAYFNKVNAEGGINGRKISFISYDDGYSPPKAIEQARKLVEGDEVLLIFQPLGTPSNSAIQKYMNAKKVPQLFVASGATKWGDPENFPWTMGWQPNYQSEGRIYAKYILEHYPNGKIAVFWQNDDAGKDQVKGLRDGLGDKAGMIVADKSYEVSDPTIDSQIVALHDSGADIFFSWAAPKGSAQAIRKVGELGWKPKFFLANTATSVAAVLKPAGLEYAKDIISTAYLKDPNLHRLPEGSDRSGMEGRSRRQDLAGLHGQILSGWRQAEREQCLRLRAGAEHGPGSQAVRRQPDPRKRHEAGRQSQGFLDRHDAARHQGQHQSG